MEVSYIISQIFVIIQYLFFVLTYHTKTKKQILIFNTIACASSALSFMFLSAYSGSVMSLLAVLRNYLFYKQDEKKDINNLIIVLVILTLLSIITYDGILSLMPSIGTLLYTISVWQSNRKIYRIFGIPIEISWLIYHIYVFSIFGIILETILFIAVVIGIIKEFNNE